MPANQSIKRNNGTQYFFTFLESIFNLTNRIFQSSFILATESLQGYKATGDYTEPERSGF